MFFSRFLSQMSCNLEDTPQTLEDQLLQTLYGICSKLLRLLEEDNKTTTPLMTLVKTFVNEVSTKKQEINWNLIFENKEAAIMPWTEDSTEFLLLSN